MLSDPRDADGPAPDTSSVGAKAFEVGATDEAGNVSRKSVSYAVGYGVSTQYDQTTVHQSRSKTPIKLRLTDAGCERRRRADRR